MLPLKVLWLSPWMRPLARVYADSLEGMGVEVLLVTSDRHPSSDAARPYELVLDPRPKTVHTWPEFVRALMVVRRFAPDVVVTELVRDPRWMVFAPRVPRVELIHDDQPHDHTHRVPTWERLLFGYTSRRSAAVVAFSQYVAGAIDASAAVPLTSDLAETMVPPVVPARGRKNFVLFGRMRPYKNLDVCMAAWQQHTSGAGWRGDKLLLIGDGDWQGFIPDHVVWQRGEFQYTDVVPVLSSAKGSVVHYRQPSQSGVQILSMQLGVTPIVSTEGALPESQPPSESALGVDDVDGLAAAFDSLADPEQAAIRGAACRTHYSRFYSANVSTDALYNVLVKYCR